MYSIYCSLVILPVFIINTFITPLYVRVSSVVRQYYFSLSSYLIYISPVVSLVALICLLARLSMSFQRAWPPSPYMHYSKMKHRRPIFVSNYTISGSSNTVKLM